MSKKKTAARGKSAKANDEKQSFVVLFDDEQKTPAVDESKTASDKDGSFVVMLDDDATPDVRSSDASPDGSFVVLLDDETQSVATDESGEDGYFVVLLDDEDLDDSCVSQVEDGVFNVVLPADLRMENVVPLKPLLVSTLSARVVQYDASRVVQADTASIQLVAAHLVALKAADASVEWVGASDEFSETARILGFDFSGAQGETELEAESAAA